MAKRATRATSATDGHYVWWGEQVNADYLSGVSWTPSYEIMRDVFYVCVVRCHVRARWRGTAFLVQDSSTDWCVVTPDAACPPCLAYLIHPDAPIDWDPPIATAMRGDVRALRLAWERATGRVQ